MRSHNASALDMVVLFSAGDHRAMTQALQHLAHTRSMGFASHPADAADPEQLFSRLSAEHKQAALVVFGGGQWQAGSALDTPAGAWDAAWRSQCLSGARVGQAAIQAFRTHPSGNRTLIFLGHANSVTDAQPARRCAPADWGAAHAAASAGLRSLAQSMARGFGPDGVHVAHLSIDSPLPLSTPAAHSVSQACWSLHAQGRSAWSHEMDLRLVPPTEFTHAH